ncbi:MAG: hypothetical protein LIO95_10025 [Clostridiales bacterium]|nr:hypothetical protein [Clostridiales bacterium]
MSKQKTPQQQVEALCEDIVREIATWNHYNEHGGQDPFWPDGCNMNLTRNHIIYDKRELAEICAKNGFELPETYYLNTPPEVPNNYMANLKQKKRVANLTFDGTPLTLRRTEYDQDQMSLL